MKPGVFREEYIAIIIRELLRGLDYLHTEGKLHRDIKGKTVVPFRFSCLTLFLPQLQIFSFPLGVK
jgi:serine/threonine protein kinase